MEEDVILVLNAGSSSIKFQLFATGAEVRSKIKGQMEGIGVQPRLSVKGPRRENLVDQTWPAAAVPDIRAAIDLIIEFLRGLRGALPVAIGHRVVHGGLQYQEPAHINEAVLSDLEKLSPLAPLHQPNSTALIRFVMERLPQIPQVACFDTAFHRGHSELADRYAIPEDLYNEGVRRYGFHGISYDYVSHRLSQIDPSVSNGKVVIAHLGSGASLCAIAGGRSIDTTMGFTALDGLPMGTRPGQLDAGVVLYLMQHRRMTAKQIEKLLYYDCGLKALSGSSNDVRVLLASQDPRSKFALDYFVYRILALTGSLASVMGGLDGIVFTAGIGENSPEIRSRVASGLAWLGMDIDPALNATGGPRISSRKSRITCLVIPTDEELMIARHTMNVVRHASQRVHS